MSEEIKYTKEELELANHYMGKDCLKEAKNSDFKNFVKELEKLSKKYGVAIQSIGGVSFGKIDKIKYSDDESSGDLTYTWTTKK